MKPRIYLLVLGTAVAAALCTLLLWAMPAGAQQPQTQAMSSQTAIAGMLAAAAATAVSSVAAAYAVAKVGTAATGAVTEKPEVFGRLLVLVGLAEGIAIYGLIVSILILNRLG